jgi:glycosyltransferase involved in cell wall biosynthesis
VHRWRSPNVSMLTARLRWHVVTSEYPPQAGGVSDYTYGVASGLAAQGDEVHVWCPASHGGRPEAEDVAVHRELGAISPADLRRVGRQLDRFQPPRRILVQWVPHGYGYRSMNLGFCWWLRNRAARHGDRVEIMVHEPCLAFRADSLRQSVAALVHRLMTILLLRAAERVWVSIPAWERRWRPYALGRRVPFQWLPIPSNIPIADNPAAVQSVRLRYAARGGTLIGHFGTFGRPITSVLEPVLLGLCDDSAKQTILLMGIGSTKFRDELVRKQPRLAGLIQATGALSAEDLSCHVAACDLLMQPYPDGLSSRRGSFLAGLSHGKPIVTTDGPLSEPFWKRSGALAMAPAGDTEAFIFLLRQLKTDPGERARMGRAARMLYEQHFDISYTIAALRQAAICAS